MFDLKSVVQVGPLVRGARQRTGMTQSELADRVGVTREWINRLEAGNMVNPGLRQILSVFGMVGLNLNVELPLLASSHETYSDDELAGLSIGKPDFGRLSVERDT